MIKAIFFDLDGTLLTSGKALTEVTHTALRRCRERGVRLFVATARSPRLDATLGWTENDLALFDGGVYGNGACVVLRGQAHWHEIAPEATRACVIRARQHDVHLSLHLADGRHAFNFELPRHVWNPWGVDERNIIPLDDEACRHAVKLLLFHENLVDSVTLLPPSLLAELRADCGSAAVLTPGDQGCSLQVAAAGVSKATGTEQIRQALGLTESEVAVFGDDLNDLPLMARYPHSVAMGNAVPEVQAAARYHTRTNDEDGVAHALTSLLPLDPNA